MILGSCLAAPERLLREDGDEEYITKISLWVSEMIRPNGDCVLENHSSEGVSSTSDLSRETDFQTR